MTNKPKTFKIASYQKNSNQNKRAYRLNLSTCQGLFLKENYIKEYWGKCVELVTL